MYTRNSLETLRQIADPKEILSSIGGVSLSSLSDNGHEIRCPCPLHGGDNPDGFSWRRSDGVWTCFTRGCGRSGSRDAYGFIMAKLHLDFIKSADKLASLFNFSLERGDINSHSDFYSAFKTVKTYSKLNRYKLEESNSSLPELPGVYSKGWEEVVRYLKIRNYDNLDSIAQFNIYPCKDSSGLLRMGIPLYDDNGNLIGVNARRMDGVISYPEGTPKYRMLEGQKTSKIMYNLNNAKEFLQHKPMIVVEGELSSIRVVTYGYPNVVALSGSSMSASQVALTYKYAFHVLFLLEEGEAARNGVIKSIKQLPGMKVSVAKLTSGDADSNPKEAVTQALESAKLLTAKDLEWIKQNAG